GPPLMPATSAAIALDEALEPFGLDAAVLGERAAAMGLRRAGRRSCGGATSLLEAADGWVALSLARDDDVASLPAAFGVDATSAEDAWPRLEPVVRARDAGDVAARAQLLGMACAVVGGVGSAAVWSVTPRGPAGSTPSTPPR